MTEHINVHIILHARTNMNSDKQNGTKKNTQNGTHKTSARGHGMRNTNPNAYTITHVFTSARTYKYAHTHRRTYT